MSVLRSSSSVHSRSRSKTAPLAIILVLLAGFSFIGCATPGTSVPKDTPPGKERPVVKVEKPAVEDAKKGFPVASTRYKPYRIGVRDVLNVSFISYRDLIEKSMVQQTGVDVTVKENGTIILPLIGFVKVEGRTLSKLQNDLIEKYKKYFKQPIVEVKVKEFRARRFFIFGEVASPGIYPLGEDLTLLDAVAIAGGITRDSNMFDSYLVRNGRVLPIDLFGLFRKGNFSSNFRLNDRDFLYVASLEDRKAYIMGQVMEPGTIQLKKGTMDVFEAIAMSGGLTNGALSRDVKIIRGGLAKPTIITVDIDEALKQGRFAAIEEAQIQTGDIIYVPRTRIDSWNMMLSKIRPSLETFIFDPIRVIVGIHTVQTLNE